MENYGRITEEILEKVKSQIAENPERLEDRDYLDEISADLKHKSSYIIVRKGDTIYYTGNSKAARKIFSSLPEFGNGIPNIETGYYYNDMRKLVKEVDFLFSDGSEGSFFIVTSINSLFSKSMLRNMLLTFIIVLALTSILQTDWITRGILKPINQLNQAMQNIAEGNLEYMLSTDEKGEIGELYRNYEDMRLRLKESADEKIEHEQKNRELVSNISHDLKTPITAIKGYVEGIMDGVADTPEKMDKYIKTIYNKANDMDRLINELTTYSGIDNNRIPYNFRRINVADYFGDCVEEVGLDLESKNIQLNYEDLVEPSAQIIADPEQLKRVINNIIGNSIKYLDKERGVIDIRILDEVDSIRVEIEDNGKGIAAKDLPNIFERFYRTDASRNSSQGGSGIGLSIVKKIVEDHGGYIWATSKEKEGTCMHFVIRKYQAAKET
jgi:signal transduction histidine kinase